MSIQLRLNLAIAPVDVGPHGVAMPRRRRGNADRSLLEASHVNQVANPNFHLGVFCRRHAASDQCRPTSRRSGNTTRLPLERKGRQVPIAFARAGRSECALFHKAGRWIEAVQLHDPARHSILRAAVAALVRELHAAFLRARCVLSRTNIA